MKRKTWTILVISNSPKGPRRIQLPGLVLVLALIMVVTGFIGLTRCGLFVGRYIYANVGVNYQKRENQELVMKLRFLERLAETHNAKFQDLVAFEDRSRLRFGMSTISEDVRKAGIGGRPSAEEIVLSSLDDPLVHRAEGVSEKISALVRQVALQDTTFSRMISHVRRQQDQWAQRPSIQPTRGRITSRYGYRYHPLLGRRAFHDGLDIANKEWSVIFATADGICSFAGIKKDYGKVVMIKHPGTDMETVYAHLVQNAVKEGQVVNRGDVVGYMGNTGRSTGPHLHYEVRKGGRHTDPSKYILPMDTVVD